MVEEQKHRQKVKVLPPSQVPAGWGRGGSSGGCVTGRLREAEDL